MGKGNGDHPPSKFINEQWLYQLSILVFLAGSITFPSLSIGMDDGGSFHYPYFFTGFVLAPVLLVNFISRWYVIIWYVEILKNTLFGQHIWPWSCKVGMLWCIPGSILSGIGGINCGIDGYNDKNSPTKETPRVRNTCYYDIEGESSEVYRGLAIGLVIVHVLSFVYLSHSNCPVHFVHKQIKADPRGNTVSRANACPPAASTAASSTTPAAAPAANNRQASASGGASKEIKTTMQQLEARVRELESRERQMQVVSVLSPPPTYNVLLNPDSCRSTGIHLDNSFV